MECIYLKKTVLHKRSNWTLVDWPDISGICPGGKENNESGSFSRMSYIPRQESFEICNFHIQCDCRDMLQLYLLPQLEDHEPDVVFQQDGAPPQIGLVLSENFLTWIFLSAGLGVMDQFRGLRAHPILRRLISSCGDMLRTMFTRPCDLPRRTEAENCCCDRDSYTANAGEHLEGNWIPLGHLTCHESSACWSCLAFCGIDCMINKSFELRFHIP
jgi:hypothetical protein